MAHEFSDSNWPYTRGFVKGNELTFQECMKADRFNKGGAKSSTTRERELVKLV